MGVLSYSDVGMFATAKRGGVTMAEIDDAKAKLGKRATPAQIAKFTGRCETDVRAFLNPAPAEPVQAAPVLSYAQHRAAERKSERVQGSTWTEREIETLRLLYIVAGLEAQQVAAEMGRSLKSILYRLRILGWNRKAAA